MRRKWGTLVLVLGCTAVVVGCGGKASVPAASEGARLFEAGDFDGARTYYEGELAASPGDAVADYYLGRIAIAQNQHGAAVDHLKSAVESAPDSARYHFWLAVAYANKVQNTQDFMEKGQLAPLMKSSIEKAVELDPEDLASREFLAQYLFSAPPIVGGDEARGWEQVDFIKGRDPKRGHLFAARIHLAKKNRDDAEKEIHAAIALDGDDPELQFRLGRFYQDGEDYDAAFAAFEAALAIDPNHMPSLYQMGRTGVFAGTHLERAIECLQKYMETEPGRNEPTWSYAHWRLGMIYEKQDRRDLARAEYEKALELDPGNEQAAEALDALDSN